MKKIRKTLALIVSFTVIFISTSCSGQTSKTPENKPGIVSEKSANKVTFIELGSVRCIPCQQMQPVMKSI